MLPDQLELALVKGARAVILTPRAHNPTGCSLSASRAAQLQDGSARYPQTLAIRRRPPCAGIRLPLVSGGLRKETTHRAIVRLMSKTLGPDFTPAIVAMIRYLSREATFTAQLRQSVGQPPVAVGFHSAPA